MALCVRMWDNARMNKRKVGIASTLAGASLWGVSAACLQFLLANYAISTLFVTMVRMGISAALFLAVLVVRRRDVLKRMLADTQTLGRVVVFGIIGLFASQLTYLITVGYTNGGTATVLQSTSIVMIMAATCITARRPPRFLELLGLVLAFSGTLLIATQGDFGSLHVPAEGLAWGLASAVGAACYAMIPQSLYPKWGSFAVVGLGMAVGALASAIVWGMAFAFPVIDMAVSSGNAIGSSLLPTLDGPGVAALLAVAVVGTFGAYYLFLNGIALVGAVRGSQLGAIEPVSATVCSAAFLGTAFTAFDWVGLVLMVATILLIAASRG